MGLQPNQKPDPEKLPLLFGMPNELLEYIFLQLHPLEIVKCRLICKHLLEIIDTSIEIQLRIELAIDGRVIHHASGIPATTLLQRTLSMRKAFEELDPPWNWETDSPGETKFNQYEVCDGIHALSTDRGATESFRGIRYTEMIHPKMKTSIDTRRWEKLNIDVGMDIQDFSFCVGTDLQILVEFVNNRTSRRIHVRTLSTNEQHPEAAVPFLQLEKADCPIWEQCLTLANKDVIAVLFSRWTHDYREAATLCWNWKTNTILMPYTVSADLAFLTEDSVLLLMDGRDTESPELGVFSYVLETITHRYKLPFLSHLEKARFLTHPAYADKARPPVSECARFLPDPELDIIGMQLSFSNPFASGWSAFYVVLSVQRFLERAEQLQRENPNQTEFEWTEWGPTVTRWLPDGYLCTTGFRSTYGSKILFFGPSDLFYGDDWTATPGQTINLTMFDFNPRPIRRGGPKLIDNEHYRMIVCDEADTWTPGRSPASVNGPIESSLPFRMFISKHPKAFLDVHLESSTIIGRLDDHYSIFSFLPRGEQDVNDDECPRKRL